MLKYGLFLLIFFSNLLNTFGANPGVNFLFIENKGQWPQNIFYRAHIPGGIAWVHSEGISYQLFSNINHGEPTSKNAKISPTAPFETIHYNFGKAFSKAEINASDDSGQLFNFYLDSNPENWKSGVKAFKEIKISNIYPQVDFRLYSSGESLKYEYIVKPGGKPNDIAFTYAGINKIEVQNKELLIHSTQGLIKEFEPFTFQKNGNTNQKINSNFKIVDSKVRFEIGNYDTSKELIIDPELVFSSFSGSVSDNWSHSATYDSKGNLYAGGTVFGGNYPIVGDVFQPKVGGTTGPNDLAYKTDIVITKFASEGSKILYSTFLGGNGSEVPHSLIVNSKDELVIFGTTSSSNFPIGTNAYQKTFKGGHSLVGYPITTGIGFEAGSDIFVTVLSENGSKLIGSTYIGGSENDGIHDFRELQISNYGDEFRGEVYVDSKDNIYVASVSNSDDFPIVNSDIKRGGSSDGVALQLNSDASKLVFSTYLSGKAYDAAYGIRVNSTGEIFVCGSTKSDDFIKNGIGLNKSFQGISDGFLLKFVNYRLVASTFVGTKDADLAMFLDLDKENNPYIFGLTAGVYPISELVYANAKSGQFIHSFSNDLSKTRFSSIFGTGRQTGRIDLTPTAFLVNDCGNIYISGWGGIINTKNGFNQNSTTKNLPITENAYQKTTTGSNYYFAIFEKGMKSLIYATYFGSAAPPNPDNERGDHLDGGTCRFDKNGIIYHSACVCKASGGYVSFPIEKAAQPTSNNSNCNMAGFKFNLDALVAKFDLTDGKSITNPEEVCAPIDLKFKNTSVGGDTYRWYVNDAFLSSIKEPTYPFLKDGIVKVTLVAYNSLNCKAVDSTSRFIKVTAFNYTITNDTTVCQGTKLKLKASGGLEYFWTANSSILNPKSAQIEVEAKESDIYQVLISNSKCSIRVPVKVTVDENLTDFQISKNQTICKGQSIELKATASTSNITWAPNGLSGPTQNSIIVKPQTSTSYTATAIYTNGCKPQKTVTVNIEPQPVLSFEPIYQYACNTPIFISFETKSENLVSFEWKLNNISLAKTLNYETSGNTEIAVNEVKLIGKSEAGCLYETSKTLNLKYWDGIIPNVITPNGDFKNDTFVVGYPDSKLEIFNAFGKKIFASEKYLNDFGGNIETGSYYYSLTIPNGQTCKGWLEVLK
jgi:hypothetical protein